MICTQCKTRNPIGNKFCRECGAQLTPDSVLAAEEAAGVETERNRESVAELLARAFALAEQNKPDAALPLAAEAAARMPESTSAHALLASLYEQTEQHEKAITAMERVVALNPQSRADGEKLEQMRRGVRVLPARERSKPEAGTRGWPSWTPLALSGATAALVLGVGFALVNRSNSTRPTATNPAPITVAARAPETAPAFPVAPISPALPLANETTSPRPGRSDPFTPTVTGGASGVPVPPVSRRGAVTSSAPATLPALPNPSAAGRNAAAAITRGGGGGHLPAAARSSSTVAPLSPAPVVAAANGGKNERFTVSPPVAARNNAPAANAAGTAGAGNTAAAEAGPNNDSADKGYIRIQVGPPQQAAPPPTAPTHAPTAATPPLAPPRPDPMLRAQSLQAAGRYAEAVGAYQQALGSAAVLRGAGRGDAYQGMAASYQRMGNAAQARLAYQQALSAYQAALGGPDAAAARQGVATCRAALEVLGDA